MAGQQHRAAVGRCLLHQLEERLLHQRVQPLGRLVQDHQLRIVLQRLHQAQLLLHAARVPAHRGAGAVVDITGGMNAWAAAGLPVVDARGSRGSIA
nr:hypothetical protein [Streptomyces sp. DSM 40907]